jgi:antitoxin component YwqK of YwqJK toxin-antitoxin module
MHNLDFKATTYSNGKFESQTMCNENKTDGFRVYWYESGQMKSATDYKHGKPDGLLTAWHENGNKSAEINYLNGHKHGACKLWYKDGLKRSEVIYANGRMDGLWVLWHTTGKIRKSILFKNCKKASETTWYSNGNIKSNIELGAEYFNRQLCKFSDVSYYGEWIDYYSPHALHDELFVNGNDLLSEGIRCPILTTHWYKNGQKAYESIQYGYDDSHINWHKNGQKSFEAGKKNSDPCISWNSQGIKEYEYIFDFDSIDDGIQTTWKFFNNTGRYAATIILNEKWNDLYEFDLFEWEFFDTRNNKLYEYKYSHSESASITTDELWDVWLNSECREFVEILKSIEKHKSVFCKF